ncbi:DUF6402 family protein [Burkholderia pseudomallei]|uniref:DUF6402 family protein n=1 Tax=Burkholderia pseudomallei TaxID=28450 RepID=UPI0012B0A7DF|nr:DUF6402 family protein [Burkholderia pseudomallei]
MDHHIFYMSIIDTSKIPFYKINSFINKWALCGGADGCEIADEVQLSSDMAPPTPAPPREAPTKPASKAQPGDGLLKMMEAHARFKAWLNTPDPPKPSKQPLAKKPTVVTIPPFDIQEIPATMRKLNMPVGAKLMERWFAGELNYSPDDHAEAKGLNQNGEPYPPSMINKTDITMKWALGFQRAKAQYEHLVKQAIFSDKSRNKLAEILSRYPSRTDVDAERLYCGDVQQVHKFLQFQRVGVESSWPAKLQQAMNRAVYDRGVPDDLTAALGSFTIYAAIERAYVGERTATVSEISVYIKDNYTFNTDPGDASQYLGHWSSKGVIVVPATEGSTVANHEWANFAVKLGDPTVKGNVYYPVRNRHFRNWQLKHHRGGDFFIYSDRIMLSLLLHPIEVFL